METTVGALSPPACQAPTRRAQLLSSILHTMTARCIMCCHLEVTTVQRTVRNRQSTRTKLLDAAERIITLRGPHHAGVNSVAAECGVDKVLIYRYFGGIDPLLKALAQERCPPADLVAASQHASSLAAAFAAAVVAEARQLRASPLALRLVAWHLVDPYGFARDHAQARANAWALFLADVQLRLPHPPFLDLETLSALLSAALTHAAIAAPSERDPAALDEHWRRTERTALAIVRALTALPDG